MCRTLSEVSRATYNEREARSSPRHLQRARSAKFPAQLATSAKREVPRATCNERGARSSPRHLQRARSAKFPAPLATSAEREVPRATCNERGARSSPRRNSQASPIKEKLVRRFLTLDLLFPYAVFHGIINTAMYIERSRDNFLSFPLFALQNTVRAVIVLRQSIAACGSYYVIRGCYGTTERFKDRRKS